jgi:hypothetical protein
VSKLTYNQEASLHEKKIEKALKIGKKSIQWCQNLPKIKKQSFMKNNRNGGTFFW